MEDEKLDVVGIGNAIVDVIAHTTDQFLFDQGLQKGSMALIDEKRARELYDLMGAGIEASGGSVANSMVGVGSFGGRAGFIGKVRDDLLGGVFAHDLRASGVAYEVPNGQSGPATGRSLILVSPDAQRTMSTFLGIASLLEPADVDAGVVERAGILFCEGYLWDVESAKQAMRRAINIARSAGNLVALSLSDSFCVERHYDEFVDLVAGPVDILFANESELAALYRCNFDTAVERARSEVALGCLTRGPQGSVLVSSTATVEVAAEPTPVVDTTGAGDQYAAGVLFGLARSMSLNEAGRLGSLAAAEVISHVGPRPQRSLSDFLAPSDDAPLPA
jgi:sugar/nucleoside kinase (ribokinase family)